jgi:hypothetical protein
MHGGAHWLTGEGAQGRLSRCGCHQTNSTLMQPHLWLVVSMSKKLVTAVRAFSSWVVS